MFEQEDIEAIQVFQWEEGKSCTHVYFKNKTIWCSDMGNLPINLGQNGL